MMLARQQCCPAAQPAAARTAARALPGAAQPRRVAAQARPGKKQADQPARGFGSSSSPNRKQASFFKLAPRLQRMLSPIGQLAPLESLELSTAVPWQQPAEWLRPAPSTTPQQADLAAAEAAVARLQAGLLVRPDEPLAVMQEHVQRLLLFAPAGYVQALGCSPAAAATAALMGWGWRQSDSRSEDFVAMFVVCAYLTRAYLAFLAHAARQPGLSREQADAVLSSLEDHTNLWGSLASVILDRRFEKDARVGDLLRMSATHLAMFLMGACQLGDVPSDKITRLEPGSLLCMSSLPPWCPPHSAQLAEWALAMSAPTGDDKLVRFLKINVSRLALAPLLSYVELQRWLAAHSPGGSDVEGGDVDLFAAMLVQHILVRSLFSSAGGVSLPDMQLGFRVLAAVGRAEPGGTSQEPAGIFGRVRDFFKPSFELSDATSKALRAMQERAHEAGGRHLLRTAAEWQAELSGVLTHAAAALEEGRAGDAEALIVEQAALLLQEPVLASLEVRPPSWQELGGERLAEAAAAAGAGGLLLRLGELYVAGAYGRKGPYAHALHPVQLLRSLGPAADAALIAEMVKGAAADDQRAWIAGEPGVWQLMGDACARLAAEDASALPALLSTARGLAGRAPDSTAAQLEVASRAAEQLAAQPRALAVAGLLALLRCLLEAAWPAGAVLSAWRVLLAGGHVVEAAQLLDQALSSAGQRGSRSGRAKRASQAALPRQLAADMAAALLDTPGAEPALLGASSSSGLAACLLASLQLERGNGAAAWEVMTPCLPAACSAEPATVQAVLHRLFDERLFEQARVLACYAELQALVAGDEDAASAVQQQAALSAAHMGAASQAAELAAPLGAAAVAEAAEVLLESGAPLPSDVATRLLLACDACQRPPAAVQLYRQLAGAAEGGCSAEVHAAGARAYLRDASSGGSSSASLQAGLVVLEAQAEPLLSLRDPALAEAAAAAASRCLRDLHASASAQQKHWGKALAVVDVAAEQRHAALQPPVQAALWGLRLQAACGTARSEALPAAVGRVVSSVAATAGGAQLLLVLQLLPGWAGGLHPTPADWGTLLGCAAEEGALAPSHEQRAAVAAVLQRVCRPLREAGPGWVGALPTSAQAAVLLLADAQGDTRLMLEAFEALEQGGAVPRVEPAALHAAYSRLIATLFAAAATDGAPAPDLSLCTRVVEGWQRQLGPSGKPVPQTAEALEAAAAVRMLGQLQYSAGWRTLAGMAAAQGRPPSPCVLTLVLRGLARKLQQGLLPDEQQQVLEAARCAVLDLSSASSSQAAAAAEEQPPTWPPLDAPLAEAALQLLLACHAAAAASSGSSSAPAAQLEEGGRALLAGLSASRTPLSPALCDLLLEALSAAPALEAWATAAFGDDAVLAMAAGADEAGAPLVLPPPRSVPAEEAALGEPAGASDAQDEQQQAAQAAAAAARRAKRLAEVDSIRDLPQLWAHLDKWGWVLERVVNDRRHYGLQEEGLPPGALKATVSTPDKSTNPQGVLQVRTKLKAVYEQLERAREVQGGGK